MDTICSTTPALGVWITLVADDHAAAHAHSSNPSAILLSCCRCCFSFYNPVAALIHVAVLSVSHCQIFLASCPCMPPLLTNSMRHKLRSHQGRQVRHITRLCLPKPS